MQVAIAIGLVFVAAAVAVVRWLFRRNNFAPAPTPAHSNRSSSSQSRRAGGPQSIRRRAA
jgi:hypothetical protein